MCLIAAAAVATLHSQVNFAILGQKFDLDARARLGPRLVEQALFEACQAARAPVA